MEGTQSSGMNQPGRYVPFHPSEDDTTAEGDASAVCIAELVRAAKEATATVVQAAAAGISEIAAAQTMPLIYFAEKIEEISAKTNSLSDENRDLWEKIKALEKELEMVKEAKDQLQIALENELKATSKMKLEAIESQNKKIQEELEMVKEAKDQLQIEIGKERSVYKTLMDRSEAEAERYAAMGEQVLNVESENKELKQIVDSIRMKNEALTEKFLFVENENKELKQIVDSIRKKNQNLIDEVKSLNAKFQEVSENLECKEKRLLIGQVAWNLEEKIWDFVLPDEEKGSTAYLKSMDNYLHSEDVAWSKEREQAQKRWDWLKRKLNWKERRHRHALWVLKQPRKDDAHPAVELKEARKQIREGNEIAKMDKKSCEEIIDMILTLENDV